MGSACVAWRQINLVGLNRRQHLQIKGTRKTTSRYRTDRNSLPFRHALQKHVVPVFWRKVVIRNVLAAFDDRDAIWTRDLTGSERYALHLWVDRVAAKREVLMIRAVRPHPSDIMQIPNFLEEYFSHVGGSESTFLGVLPDGLMANAHAGSGRPRRLALQLAQADVLPQHRINELIHPLSFLHAFQNRTVFFVNKAGDKLINELNVELFSDLP
jgi:hypothetical protein